jgi:hypothetical protein
MFRSVHRHRWVILLCLLGTIALGVASRKLLREVPIVGKELGAVLWPVMFYLIALLAIPTLKPAKAAIFALVLSMGTEALQAYEAPWIETVRDTQLGGLVLGRYFSWHDMACYPIGTAIAWGVDRLIIRLNAGRRVVR